MVTQQNEEYNKVIIKVKTGDFKFSGTDDDIYITLCDALNNTSVTLQLKSAHPEAFERGKIDTFDFKSLSLNKLKSITKIEIWREGRDNRIVGDDWFVDYVSVKGKAGGTTHMFPVNRWIPLRTWQKKGNITSDKGDGATSKDGEKLIIKEYDSYLPCHDEDRMEQRTRELIKKRQQFQLKLVPQHPEIPLTLLHMPDDVRFTDEYMFYLRNRKRSLEYQCKLEMSSRDAWEVIDDIKQIYGSKVFPIPKTIEDDGDLWMTDEYFAHQRLAGINPVLIELCTKIPPNFAVTSDMVKGFLEGKSLPKAIEKKKIFIVNHELCDNLIKTKETLILCSPMCLFYLNNEDKLLPIAIQLFQKPGENNPVFLPSDAKYTWLLAKMWFNNADSCVHEAVTHNGCTHLAMEGVAVVTHRQLSPSHPLFRLLAPHFRNLFAINAIADPEFIGPGGWVDRCTTIGRIGMFNMVKKGFPQWRLDIHGTLPNDLNTRGVADRGVLPVYPYRDDALLIYNAIFQYVTDILEFVYTDGHDKDPQINLGLDVELQAWAQELTDPKEQGGCEMPGIPRRFTRLDDLISTVTSIIFTCSGGHSAVNFLLYDDYAFTPAYPAILYGEPPRDKEVRSEADLMKCLPDKERSLDIMSTTRLGSDYVTNRLGDFEIQYAYDLCSVAALHKFNKNLAQIEQEINRRNTRRRIPYTALLPSNITNCLL